MPYAIGQRVRAPELRDSFPQLSVLLSDAATISSTVLTDTAGLFVNLEPQARYIFDGYIAFDTSATAEVTVGFRAPVGSTGHWAQLGQDASAAGLDAYVQVNYNDTAYAFSEGGPNQVVFPHGYIATAGAGGPLQFRFAQGTSTASTTSLRKGSWLRLLRIG